jgi:hypothetical protein
MKNRRRKTKRTAKNNEIALDLRHCSENYSGLEISKSDLTDSPKGKMCGTIEISEWVRPENMEIF